ncbi:unnamed protein product [Anisakis simplex]|uniref:Phosphatase trehalose-6-phosphate n=1 Tax=Anisakis simplex TaxID=6269 RepID=A0A0M3K1M1_ANISI|nr:unnamed protein product [Anisakis simplex]
MTVMATDSSNVTTAKEDSQCAADNDEQIHPTEHVAKEIENRIPSVDIASDHLDHLQSVDEFKSLMYSMQSARRKIVMAILGDKEIENDWIEELRRTYAKITDSNTKAFQREMSTLSSKLSINIKDEAMGLLKDMLFLERLKATKSENEDVRWPPLLAKVDLASILAAYHPISEKKFFEEYEECLNFLRSFAESNSNGRKPIFITDWDGTMKDYCSQYATNLQPIYSAVGMTRFASRFTRLSAVLTAGPLRGPGILDLTAMPIDGPVLFSGSWGREWWLGGRRVVHEDGISDEGFDALERLNDEMGNLLHSGDYSQFALVGSGVQRKVDRLTLGVQTVYGHVLPELSHRYQDAVRERMHRVDPQNHILVFDPSTELEVEVVAHNSGNVWNKADGVDRVVSTVGDSLETPGRVLVCGDTFSDLPMVRQAATRNPEGVMALFVGLNEKLRQSVRQLITDQSRRCFISCPDVVHAAMAELLNEKLNSTQ